MLAITTAFKEEVNDYLKRGKFKVVARDDFLRFYQSSNAPDVVVAEGGIGRQGAERATVQLIERYKPDFIVSAGFCGGVQPGLDSGDLFICNKLMSVEGAIALWRADDAIEQSVEESPVLSRLIADAQEARHKYGRCACLSVPQLISGSPMKAWIGATFPVSIIDMESYWVSNTAAEHGVPHAVVRCVLDPVEQTLPDFVGETVTASGRRTWVRAAKQVVTRPTETPKLIHLARQVKAARATLGIFLTRLGAARI